MLSLHRSLVALFFGLTLVGSSFGSSHGTAKKKTGREVSFKSDITALTAIAGQTYSQNLKDLLSKPGTGKLVWSTSADIPAWMTVDSANGKLTGTPSISDAGKKSFRLNVQDNDSGSITRIDMTVILAPFFTQNPVPLGKQPEGKSWSFDLRPLVQNVGGSDLAFSAQNAPKWMKLDPKGTLSGTPLHADVGPYSGIVFTVSISSGAQSSANASGEVTSSVAAPTWMANPLVVENAGEDFPFSQDISGAGFVSNPTGAALSFSLIGSVPNWLKISATGNLFGKPGKMDVGPVSVGARISATINGAPYTTDTVVKFSVAHTNHTPVWSLDPVVLPDAKIKALLAVDLAPYASDPDGDSITFKIISGPKWASLSSKGMLTGTPDKTNVGTNEWVVAASDAEFSAKATVRVKVFKRGPFWIVNPTPLPDATEGEDYLQLLTAKVQNPDGDTLNFALVSGPAWGTVTPQGKLSGVPKAADGPVSRFQISVSDGISPVDQAEVDVKVRHVNHAPKWNQDPVVLGNGKVKVPYVATVATFASDPDVGDSLSFSKVSGPDWVTIEKSGEVKGTPQAGNIGANNLVVRVSDLAGLCADANVKITVEKVNHPPTWTADPVDLKTVTENANLSFDLSSFAKDPDGDTLTFKLIVGPAWLAVSPQGKVTGIPKHADVGAFTAVFEVSDGTATAQAGGKGTVIPQIYPPKINQELLNFTVREREDFKEDLSLAKYVTDPQNLPLTFTLVDTKAWATLSSGGKLALSPQFKDIGKYSFRFTVANSSAKSNGVLQVAVVRDPRPPVWLQSPVPFDAKARIVFNATLSDKAKDLDGLKLSFVIKSGPSWLTVNSDGKISGTPPDSAVGVNNFTVTARNDQNSSDGNVTITVVATNHPPVWMQDPIALPNATSGILFGSSVADFAKDADNDPLTFSKESGATWVNVSKDGKISGTPAKTDIGVSTFKVRVTDPGGTFAVATVNVKVLKQETPPKWLKDPVPMADATETKPYSFDLATWATDEDGDALTFKKIAGPNWIKISDKGIVTGNPQAGDVGNYVGVFSVTDGKSEVQAGAIGKVIGLSPIVHPENLVFNLKERQPFSENLNQAKFVEDSSGRPLTFTLTDASTFVTLTSSGGLSTTPAYKDIGTYQLNFKVNNGVLDSNGILKITVTRDPRPPIWLESPVRLKAIAKIPFTGELKDKAKDLDAIPIKFTKKSGPDWLSVSYTGQVTGTPQIGDVGDATLVVTAQNDVLSADGTVVVSVVVDNHPPVWLQDPVNLSDAAVTKSYAQSVASYATDPDGDAITFSKASGPTWAFVTTSGLVIGVPENANLGINSLRVRVTDIKGAFTDATVNINVKSESVSLPKWVQDPIPLGSQTVGAAFNFDLAPLASDPGGNPLTFKKISGPGWLTVSPNGKITGTPGAGDAGEYMAQFEVNNGKLGVQAGAYGKVIGVDDHPAILSAAQFFSVRVGENLRLDLNQAKYVTSNRPITFRFTSTDSWISISADGYLQAQPAAEHFGMHTYSLVVTNDKGNSDQKDIKVQVTRDPQPPQWTQNPISLDAKVNVAINSTIATFAKDPLNLPLTFTKTSGPAWLGVAANGVLAGTPSSSDTGENKFSVTANNDSLGAAVSLIIKVGGNSPVSEKIYLDETVPGAAVENLWVIDNLWPKIGKNKMIRQLKENIQVYTDALDRAQIHHTGVMLSSIAGAPWNSLPVYSSGSPLMLWSDSSWTRNFQLRVNTIQTRKGTTSPLWTMFSFYTQAVGLPLYHNGYFTSGVPMEVMMVTRHGDFFSEYAKSTPQSNWTPSDYGRNFAEFHQKNRQPYRVNVIAPISDKLFSSGDGNDDDGERRVERDSEERADGAAYQAVAQATKGVYYAYDNNGSIASALTDYAAKIILRANIAAKTKVSLKNKPADASQIKIYLADHLLPGNTGGLDDMWTLDGSSGNGAVLLRWDRIDISSIKAGDVLEIRYTVR